MCSGIKNKSKKLLICLKTEAFCFEKNISTTVMESEWYLLSQANYLFDKIHANPYSGWVMFAKATKHVKKVKGEDNFKK